MSTFEFAFSLFGLLLGLSVAEIMGGFARVLKARRAIRLGWLTPLLGLLLTVDLVTFWENAWNLRDSIAPDFWSLSIGTAIAAIYFLAASLVFPDRPADWPDLDAWFMAHKGQVMLGVLAANLLATGARFAITGLPPANALLVPLTYSLLALALVTTRSKAFSLGVLLFVLSLYVYFWLQ